MSLKRNPFWFNSSEDIDSDTSSDVDNISDTKHSSKISKKAHKKNPLQRIALSYASSDDDIDDAADDEDNLVICRDELTLPTGKKTPFRFSSSDDDESEIEEVGNDSFITITTPEDSSDNECETDSDNDGDEDEKFAPAVTRSRTVALPELPNLAIKEKKCVLKLCSKSLVQIVDIVTECRESVASRFAAEDDDYESQFGEDDAEYEVKVDKSIYSKPRRKPKSEAKAKIHNRRKRKIKAKISHSMVRSCYDKDSVNLAVSDPWSLKLIKKCWIKVKRVCVHKPMQQKTKQCTERLNVDKLDGHAFISMFAHEIVQKIRGVVTTGKMEDDVAEKGDGSQVINEGESTVNYKSPNVPEIVPVVDSKLLVMASPTLQSFSISSSGQGLDDSESDEDVVIIEETFVGPFPGSEFQSTSPPKIVSNSHNTSLAKDNEQISRIVVKPEKLLEPEVETLMIVEKKIKEDAYRSPNKVHKTFKPMQSKERKKTDLYKVKKVKTKASDISKQEVKLKPSFGEMLMSSLDFKIPKTKTKKEPGKVSSFESRKNEVVNLDGQNVCMKKFLEQEDIVADVSLESYTASCRDRQVFDSMYEDVNAIKNTTVKKNPEVNDETELEDMGNVGWDDLKRMETDEDRKSWVQAQFKNPICSDPARNLTFHGFRRLAGEAGQMQDPSSASFYISRGQLVPLAGSKRKERDAMKNELDVKKIKLSDFGSFMKGVFFSKFNKKLGSRKASSSDFEAFKTYLGHYKGGQEETSNFLSYYNPRKELDEDQSKEVVDLENQFSTFSNYYGEAEDLFCKQCEKRHKFCQ